MEMVFIDPEPPDPTGGGIRAYLRLTLEACAKEGIAAKLYTHNPDAYPGHAAKPIGRMPWLPWPFKGMAYRLAYHDNILWEHAMWLREELERDHTPARIYEFADYQGYAFFVLRSPKLAPRAMVRIHTPAYLTLPRASGLKAKVARASLAFRERDCLLRCGKITTPSAAFAAARLPWVKAPVYLPNPLPPRAPGNRAPWSPGGTVNIIALGRVEPRKGTLTLLAAFGLLCRVNSKVTLTLIGSAPPGPYGRKIKAAMDTLPADIKSKVAWHGPCPPEKRDTLLAGFQVIAVPSLWENSPYTYFEGMAAGLLCVGSRTGEMGEVGQVTGSPLAAPGDPEDLARALGEACNAWDRPDRLSELLGAQVGYLEDRRAEIPARLLAYYHACYREASKEAGEGRSAA